MDYVRYDDDSWRLVPHDPAAALHPLPLPTLDVPPPLPPLPEPGPPRVSPPIIRRYELGSAAPTVVPESARYDAAVRSRMVRYNLHDGTMARTESVAGASEPPPRTHTVIRTPADTMESEIRSELSILRHQIYELRDRTLPPQHHHPQIEPQFHHHHGQPGPPPPYPEDLRREFDTLQNETRQIKRELADLRQQMTGAPAPRPPRESLPSRDAPTASRPAVPVTHLPPPPRPPPSPPRGPTGGRATLGVEVKQRGDLLAVHRVVPGGPCDLAGVRPGDVLRRWEGHALPSKPALERLLAHTAPGSVVLLTVQRYGRTLPVRVIIGGPTPSHHHPEPQAPPTLPPKSRYVSAFGRGAFEPLQPLDAPRGRVKSLPPGASYSSSSNAAAAVPRTRSASRERSPVRTRRHYSEETETTSGRYEF